MPIVATHTLIDEVPSVGIVIPIRFVQSNSDAVRRDIDFIREKYRENQGYFQPASVGDWEQY